MTLSSKARGLSPVHPFENAISVIKRVAQVRGGATTLASADRTCLEHDDFAAGTREAVRGRQAGDTRPDYANIGLGGRLQSGALR
jgi:hypothetical protein